MLLSCLHKIDSRESEARSTHSFLNMECGKRIIYRSKFFNLFQTAAKITKSREQNGDEVSSEFDLVHPAPCTLPRYLHSCLDFLHIIIACGSLKASTASVSAFTCFCPHQPLPHGSSFIGS
ncbi:hypothetical protein AAZV13_14G081200 [Glycine max]